VRGADSGTLPPLAFRIVAVVDIDAEAEGAGRHGAILPEPRQN